jgi:hypothetical protein
VNGRKLWAAVMLMVMVALFCAAGVVLVVECFVDPLAFH